MINIGESKKVTAVLNIYIYFFKCLELPGVIIFRNNFTFLQSLKHRSQDKLVFWCDFKFSPPYYKGKNLDYTPCKITDGYIHLLNICQKYQ